MTTVQVNLSFEQITQALRQLPPQEKIALWRLLDEDIDRPALAQRFASSVNTIRKAYADHGEDEVMADATKASRDLRARARRAKNRS